MKKDIVIVDKEKRIMKVTTVDERWYTKQIKNKAGLPEYKYYPSVTWITGYYYTSPYLIKYIADKGLTESDRLMKEAGLKGSKVHQATESLDRGEELTLNTKLTNPETGMQEEVTVEEWEAILSYKNWFQLVNPQVLATEMTVFNEAYEYAGTLDRIVRIKGQIFILDIKTSKNVWKEHLLQCSAYKYADINYKKLGITDKEWKDRQIYILQLGYKLNKAGFKVTVVEQDRFKLFLNAMDTWKEENPDSKPKQRDYPLTIKLDTEDFVVTTKEENLYDAQKELNK